MYPGGPLAVEGAALMRDPATARRRASGPAHGSRPGCAHGSLTRASCFGAMGLRPRLSPDDSSHFGVLEVGRVELRAAL